MAEDAGRTHGGSRHLTEREVDVLRLMGNGDSNKVMRNAEYHLDTVKNMCVTSLISYRQQSYPCRYHRGAGRYRRNPITHIAQTNLKLIQSPESADNLELTQYI